MATLLLVNLPYNASDRELREWIESRGIQTDTILITRCPVMEMSIVFGKTPAASGLIELKDGMEIQEAISILNGKRMRNQIILAKEAPVHALASFLTEITIPL